MVNIQISFKKTKCFIWYNITTQPYYYYKSEGFDTIIMFVAQMYGLIWHLDTDIDDSLE